MEGQSPLKQSFFLAAWDGGQLVYINSDQVVALQPYDAKTYLRTASTVYGGSSYGAMVELPVAEVTEIFKSHGYDFVITPPPKKG